MNLDMHHPFFEKSKNAINLEFEAAKNKIVDKDRTRIGIGTLSEKTIHAVLKNYYEPDEDKHEIPIEGYVADIYTGKEIIEIQSGQFNRMREKLKAYLPLYTVTIVYPIPKEKWIIWIDEETGEMSNKRKSPKIGNPYMTFLELYKIKMFLKDKNLKLKICLINVVEYKVLNGWSKDKKKGAGKFDKIPISLEKEVVIERIEDYNQFVPYELKESFTSKEFAKAAHINAKLSGVVLNILYYVGVLERIGKNGNSYLYENVYK